MAHPKRARRRRCDPGGLSSRAPVFRRISWGLRAALAAEHRAKYIPDLDAEEAVAGADGAGGGSRKPGRQSGGVAARVGWMGICCDGPSKICRASTAR